MTYARDLPTLRLLTIALLMLGCASVRPAVPSGSPVTAPAEKPQSSKSKERAATPDDLRILERADTTWSLFCAMKQATEEVLGAYRHDDRIGQAATREVRRVIEELNPGVRFEHRLMDYNNVPTTTFEDIKKVLQLARQRVAADLAKHTP